MYRVIRLVGQTLVSWEVALLRHVPKPTLRLMVLLVLSHVLLYAPLRSYVSFMWEMRTLTSVSLKNWVSQEIVTWIIPFSFE